MEINKIILNKQQNLNFSLQISFYGFKSNFKTKVKKSFFRIITIIKFGGYYLSTQASS